MLECFGFGLGILYLVVHWHPYVALLRLLACWNALGSGVTAQVSPTQTLWNECRYLQRFWGWKDLISSAVMALLFLLLAIVCAIVGPGIAAVFAFLATLVWVAMVVIAVIDVNRGLGSTRLTGTGGTVQGHPVGAEAKPASQSAPAAGPAVV